MKALGTRQGEKQSGAKLSADEVRAIRAEFKRTKNRTNAQELAKKYKIAPAYVSQIVLRYAWKHI